MPWDKVTPAIRNQSPRLLTLLLGAGMTTATGWQAYLFWQELQNTGATVPVKAAVQPRPAQPGIKVSEAHLFGAENSDDAPAELSEDLPETNLRLVLRGVSASAFESDARSDGGALIEGPDRKTNYYLIGSELPGSASLKAVYPDRIVIARQGSLEKLYFPEEYEITQFEIQNSEQSL